MTPVPMQRYYFHTQDGVTVLDDVGIELPGLAAVRDAAVNHSGELLREGAEPTLWDGTPWRLWVSGRADGGGEVFCELHFSAATAAKRSLAGSVSETE